MAAAAMYDTVHIGSLPPGTDESIIKEIFGQYAPIHAVKVLETAGPGVEALVGIGKEASKWVVDNLNGNIPQGFQTPVTIQLVPPQHAAAMASQPPQASHTPQPQMGQTGPPRDNLRIQGLPQGCTDDYFRQIFAQYANVVSCKVIPQTPGREDCVGFMKFGSNEEAKYILDTLNGNIPQGLQKPLSIKYASDQAMGGSEEGDWQCPLCSNINFRRRENCNRCGAPRPAHLSSPPPAAPATAKGCGGKPGRTETPPNIQLYVAGLPMGTTEDTLKQFFFQYGEVYHSKVLQPTGGKTVMSGFVRMPEFEAQWCIENLNDFQPEGFPGPLTVQYAKDKETGKKGGPKGCMGGPTGPKGGMGMGMGGMDSPMGGMDGSMHGMDGMDGSMHGPMGGKGGMDGLMGGKGGMDGPMGGKGCGKGAEGGMGKGFDASGAESGFSNGFGGKDGGKGSFPAKGDSFSKGEGKGQWGGWGGQGSWSESWDGKGMGMKGGKDGKMGGGMGSMGKGKDDGKGGGKGGKDGCKGGGDAWSWGGGWDQWSQWDDWSWGPMMMKGKGKGKKSSPY